MSSTDEPSPVIIFHKNCLDGRASAAVIHRLLGGIGTYLPMQYGQKLRLPVLGRRVWILDFALDESEMRRIAAEALAVTWLDHHASNRELHQRLGWGILDESHCGATLAWQESFPDQPRPLVLDLVRDRDLWLWQLPNSREITAGLTERFSDKEFAGILEADLEEMCALGLPLVKAQHERVSRAVKHGVVVSEPYGLRGVQALVVNAQGDHSEIGERIYSPTARGGLNHDLAIMFFLRSDGRWVHTLRSASVDCARIASHRGGGGHPNAAGYVADQPFPCSADCLDWPQ